MKKQYIVTLDIEENDDTLVGFEIANKIAGCSKIKSETVVVKEYDSKIIEEIKNKVYENYDSEMCGATSEWSHGNSDDVFSDGESSGKSWLAYEIGCLLGMELEEPQEPKYSWED